MAKKGTEAGKGEQDLRAFALSYPESYEDFPWGDRVIKVKGKIFLFLSAGSSELSFALKLPQSADGVLMAPFAQPTGYGLGKAGWVSCSFGAREKAPLDLIHRWIDESYRAVAPKKLVALLPERGPALHKKADGPKKPVRKIPTKALPKKKPKRL